MNAKDFSKKALVTAMSLSLILGLASCKKSDDGADETFDLPPRLSMVISDDPISTDPQAKAISDALSYYDYSGSAKGLMEQDAVAMMQAGQTYFGLSALEVGVWVVAVELLMLVPKAVFLEAFKHKPTLNADGKWQWNYNVGFNQVKLLGYIQDQKVMWEVWINNSFRGISNYNWFNGEHDLAYTQGTWTMKEDPKALDVSTPPVDALQITWMRDLTNNTANLKYDIVKPSHEYYGGYLSYGSTVAQYLPGYDRFFNIYNPNTTTLHEVEWNHTTLAGRRQVTVATVPEDWLYWDENKNDLVDPPL